MMLAMVLDIFIFTSCVASTMIQIKVFEYSHIFVDDQIYYKHSVLKIYQYLRLNS